MSGFYEFWGGPKDGQLEVVNGDVVSMPGGYYRLGNRSGLFKRRFEWTEVRPQTPFDATAWTEDGG